jgi:long-chain fatty acid transport protein
MKMTGKILGGLLVLALSAGTAYGSGFAIIEQGVSGLGNAYSGGAAIAEDATTVFFNPAGMTRIQGRQAVGALHVIVPSSKFDGSASNAVGMPVSGGDGGDGGKTAYVPNAYFICNPADTPWAFGLAVNSPFGLVTEWNDGWVGRYHAIKSDVKTININPSVAYKVDDHFSIGFGLNAQYIDAELTNDVDYATILRSSMLQDGRTKLTADDWGYGYNFGLLFEVDENTRFGASYRSKIEYTAKGNADFDFSDPLTAGVVAGLPLFKNGNAQADITLPGSASFSVFHRYNEKFAVMADISWTDWSKFDELRVEFDNPYQPDNVTNENWEDTWRYSIGATYSMNEKLDLRFGLAYDETPIPSSAYRTPRIPGSDRTWVSLGAGYRFNDALKFDFAYAHLFVPDAQIRQVVDAGSSSSEVARGNLVGTFDNEVDIASLQVTYSF